MIAVKLIGRADAAISTSTTRRLAADLFVHYCSFCARMVLRIRKPLIISVTGSAGKTTTVHMITAALRHPAAAR